MAYSVEQLLTKAVRQRRIATFRYRGLIRTVEPHILGESAATRRPMLSGYQIGGASDSADLPSWRTFYVEDITDVHVTEAPFVPPADYNPADPHFADVRARA
jgi:hypothetical protein